MSYRKVQGLQTLVALKEAMATKRSLKFLLPLSIFFFLLSNYYSSRIQCLFQSVNLSHTTSLLHDLNHFINRKVVFMFCNAILLFLARDFGSRGSSAPANEHHDTFVARQGDNHGLKPDSNEMEAQALEEKPVEERVDPLEVAVVGEGEEGEGTELVSVDEDLVVEELNRKIEEFIKKVKRERMLEAWQLIEV